jgi:hypothetical protein
MAVNPREDLAGIEFQAEDVPITSDQLKSLKDLAKRWSRVLVGHGTFDLPEGYITVQLYYASGLRIYGGISPEGDVST